MYNDNRITQIPYGRLKKSEDEKHRKKGLFIVNTIRHITKYSVSIVKKDRDAKAKRPQHKRSKKKKDTKPYSRTKLGQKSTKQGQYYPYTDTKEI